MSTWLEVKKKYMVYDPNNEEWEENTDSNYNTSDDSVLPIYDGVSINGGMKQFERHIISLTGVGAGTDDNGWWSPEDLLGIADMLEDALVKGAEPFRGWDKERFEEWVAGIAKIFRELGTLGRWVFIYRGEKSTVKFDPSRYD